METDLQRHECQIMHFIGTNANIEKMIIQPWVKLTWFQQGKQIKYVKLI